MTQENKIIEPWYKQGWPWALIAIPFLTVIAGVTTYQIAANSPHQMVQDNYYKKGLAINSDLELIDHAKKLKLAGELTFNKDAKLIILKLKASRKQLPVDKMKSKLLLNFSHPTISKLDQQLYLEAINNNELEGEDSEFYTKEYIASFDHVKKAYWHISIMDEDKTWQLKSRWFLPETTQIKILPIR